MEKLAILRMENRVSPFFSSYHLVRIEIWSQSETRLEAFRENLKKMDFCEDVIEKIGALD